MSDYIVRIELTGRHTDGDEYARLDAQMGIEGFKRKTYPSARFQPLNLTPHPGDMPHATYFGQSSQESSTLRSQLESRIKRAVQSEIVVYVVATVDDTVHQ